MLCMMCIVYIKAQDTPPPTTEQSGSGWVYNPNDFHAKTVVYAVVDDIDTANDPIYEREGSQIAALIDGEVRALVDVNAYKEVSINDPITGALLTSKRIYTIAVGGDNDDMNKEISFQFYDAVDALTYPLSCLAEAGETTLTFQGNVTLVEPSASYTLSFVSINDIAYTTNSDFIQVGVGETIKISDLVEIIYWGPDDDTPPTMPLNQGSWSWIPNEEFGGEVAINGDEITGVKKGSGQLIYKLGNLEMGLWGQVVVPVTSISIADMTVYKGYTKPIFTETTFNNGESVPTELWLEYEYDENKLVFDGEDEFGNPSFIAGDDAEIGDVIEVTAKVPSRIEGEEENAVSTTFKVTIGSVIDTYTPAREIVNVWIFDGELDLSNMVTGPNYTILPELDDETFYDYFNSNLYDYSIVSDNPEVVGYNSDGILVAKSKGEAHVTFTNAYDPTKTAIVTVNVNQVPLEVAITSVNGVEIPEASPSMPVVEVAIGQTVTAIANVAPLNADFDDFTIEFVDANHGPLGNRIEDMSWIEYESTVENGVCTLTFTANRLPIPADQDIYLMATVSNEFMDPLTSSLVKVVFGNKVSEIVVPESKTVWVNQLPSKEIMVDIVPEIYPEDATNKELEITFDKEGILEAMTDGNLLPNQKGTVNVTYTSVDNPSVTATCEVTIKVRVQTVEYALETDKLELYNDGNWTELPEIEYYPEYADFDPDYLYHITVVDNEAFPAGWDAVHIDGTRISGRALCDDVSVTVGYDAAAQEGLEDGNNPTFTFPATVKEKIDLTEGWNWISLISGEADVRYALNDEAGSSAITEVRSQTALIYNDPVFGFFGDLTVLAPRREAYKIDAARDASMIIEWVNIHSMIYDNAAFDQNINPRWNWVGYPYEYEYLLSEAYDATQLAEGDMVITKTGDMAIIKDGEWTGDFSVKPNTGMMLYHNGDAEMSLPMKARGDLYQGYWEGDAMPRAKGRDISVWQYDGSRFPNMMAVVGQLNIDSADDYTIGAFVGDECRGAGKIVDGLVLVSLAGKSGEKVTFRLHNEWTGEFIEVDNVLNFSDMAGSLKNPVMLNVPEDATAIDNVSTEGISINGNVLNFGTYKGTATVTSIDGKVVAKTTESSISVDELPAGIYVVVIEGGAKPIVKKIVKE